MGTSYYDVPRKKTKQRPRIDSPYTRSAFGVLGGQLLYRTNQYTPCRNARLEFGVVDFNCDIFLKYSPFKFVCQLWGLREDE